MEERQVNSDTQRLEKKIRGTQGYVMYIGLVTAIVAGMNCYALLATIANPTTRNEVTAALYTVLFGLMLALLTGYILQYIRLLFEKLGNKE